MQSVLFDFIHKKERNIVSLEDMKKDLIYILGDGISFWKICIDITSKKVVEVVIDGIARQ